MHRNLPVLTWTTTGFLILSALFNLFFVFKQIMISKGLENASNQLTPVPQYQTLVQSFVSDLMAYRQKQPAIDPILKKYGLIQSQPATSNPTH